MSDRERREGRAPRRLMARPLGEPYVAPPRDGRRVRPGGMRVHRWVLASLAVLFAVGAAGALTVLGGGRGTGTVAAEGSLPSPVASAGTGESLLEAIGIGVGPGPSSAPASVLRADPYDRPTRRPPAPETLTGYRWPLTRGQLTGDYGPARGAAWVVDGERFHDGIDIASYCGAPIVAAHAGRVLAAGRRYDRYIGWVGDVTPYEEFLTKKQSWSTLPITVVVDDGNGYRSIYTHLMRASVKRGATVKAGQLIGYQGASGNASGCHLHYGIFSPLETATFSFRKDLAKKWSLPAKEIARIDPFLVLPPQPRTITLGWGVTPRPAPSVLVTLAHE